MLNLKFVAYLDQKLIFFFFHFLLQFQNNQQNFYHLMIHSELSFERGLKKENPFSGSADICKNMPSLHSFEIDFRYLLFDWKVDLRPYNLEQFDRRLMEVYKMRYWDIYFSVGRNNI